MSTTTHIAPNKAPKYFGITGLIMLLVALLVITTTSLTGAKGPAAAAHTEQSPTETATTTGPTAACKPQYVQVVVSNEGDKVNANFAQAYGEATASAANLSDAQRTVILEQSAQSAPVLAAWAHAFSLYEDPNAWQPLIDGSCLSMEGMMLHAQLEGALNAKGVTFEEAEAPANGYNSGISNGVYGVASEPGIRGDRKAIKVTLPDGSVVYIMVRCGNPVYPGKPNLPEVPTDNPPPPEQPPPVDTPKCPWNPALPPDSPDCLKPKSNNPNDYRRPGDGGKGQDVGTGTKPQAPDPGTAPQPAPAPVVVQQPGGRGVVDTPTAPRGSESGGVAPGATPAPAQPEPVPSQESGGNGDNDGTVGEF